MSACECECECACTCACACSIRVYCVGPRPHCLTNTLPLVCVVCCLQMRLPVDGEPGMFLIHKAQRSGICCELSYINKRRMTSTRGIVKRNGEGEGAVAPCVCVCVRECLRVLYVLLTNRLTDTHTATQPHRHRHTYTQTRTILQVGTRWRQVRCGRIRWTSLSASSAPQAAQTSASPCSNGGAAPCDTDVLFRIAVHFTPGNSRLVCIMHALGL